MAGRGRPRKAEEDRTEKVLTVLMVPMAINRLKELVFENGLTRGEFVSALLDLWEEGGPTGQGSGVALLGRIGSGAPLLGGGGIGALGTRTRAEQHSVRVTHVTYDRFIKALGESSPGKTNGQFLVGLMRNWDRCKEEKKRVEEAALERERKLTVFRELDLYTLVALYDFHIRLGRFESILPNYQYRSFLENEIDFDFSILRTQSVGPAERAGSTAYEGLKYDSMFSNEEKELLELAFSERDPMEIKRVRKLQEARAEKQKVEDEEGRMWRYWDRLESGADREENRYESYGGKTVRLDPLAIAIAKGDLVRKKAERENITREEALTRLHNHSKPKEAPPALLP